jgi:hypothetical protein
MTISGKQWAIGGIATALLCIVCAVLIYLLTSSESTETTPTKEDTALTEEDTAPIEEEDTTLADPASSTTAGSQIRAPVTTVPVPVVAPTAPVSSRLNLKELGVKVYLYPDHYGPEYQGSNCTDGNRGTICHSQRGNYNRPALIQKLGSLNIIDVAGIHERCLIIHLPVPKHITKVTVVNRIDCCKNRIVGSSMNVYNASGEKKVSETLAAEQDLYTYSMDVADASVILVTTPASGEYLNLSEVEVEGY